MLSAADKNTKQPFCTATHENKALEGLCHNTCVLSKSVSVDRENNLILRWTGIEVLPTVQVNNAPISNIRLSDSMISIEVHSKAKSWKIPFRRYCRVSTIRNYHGIRFFSSVHHNPLWQQTCVIAKTKAWNVSNSTWLCIACKGQSNKKVKHKVFT